MQFINSLSCSVWRILLLVTLATGLSACNSQPDQGGKESGDTEENQSSKASGDVEDLPPWIGRWMFVFTQRTTDFRPFLIQIEETPQGKRVSTVDKAAQQPFQSWEVVQAMFREDSQAGDGGGEMLLVVKVGEQEAMSFVGRLHPEDEMILGAFFRQGEAEMITARLEKTPLTSMSEVEVTEMAEGTEDFETALQAEEEPLKALREFVEEHPNSPLSNQAHIAMVRTAVDEQLSVEKVDEIAANAIEASQRWGSYLLPDTLLQISAVTASENDYRSVARSSLDQLKNILTDEAPEFYAERMKLFEAQYLLSSDSEEDQQNGVDQLQQIVQQRPFELNALVSLATHFEKTGKNEKALEIYSRLAVLPGLNQMLGALPPVDGGEGKTALEKTRELSGKSGEELEQYLTERYEEEAFYFVEDEKDAPSLRENRRIPMVELFTGSTCPPCVAADLALGGLEKKFPAPEIITVRYHQHIPGPDPMTNANGEARFGYYSGQGTPIIRVNGQEVGSFGGRVFQAEEYYNQLLSNVQSLLSQPSPVKIDLQATRDGNNIDIKANVSGVTENRDRVRLRLLVVDPLIDYTASNGIRLHEMVMRAMPGGPGGIAVKNGKASFEERVAVPELKKSVISEIEEFEKNREYEFKEIPGDFSELRVIAFVQDDDSNQILQSAISPVLNFPDEKKATESEGETEEPEKEKEAGEKKPAASSENDDQPTDEKKSEVKEEKGSEEESADDTEATSGENK